MTTKVVKGSIWTLAGTVVPLMATFISTPFVIRILGSEAYGVLIFVGLIPNYFAFADFGMGIASTRFGSAAFGQGNRKKEGQVVRAALIVALVTSSLVAFPIFVFSDQIVREFSIPQNWHWEASLGLRLTAVSFVFGVLASVVNTPQLARLRMDLNSSIGAGCKLLLAVATPTVLFLGGGVVEAVVVGLIIAILAFSLHLLVSSRLLPTLLELEVDRSMFSPLLKFGAGLVVAGVAGMLLVNLEKLLLSRFVSVRSLAYYSIAFTFANMATMFSQAMVQSLIPAFSQLAAPDRREQFESLYGRSIRLNLLLVVPGVVTLAAIAEPFLTIWAGREFGINSTGPFYILLCGLLFNMIAYIPHATLTAFGRTDILAKVYWIELPIYAVLATGLVYYYGVIGAAVAWAIRVVIDTLVFLVLARSVIRMEFSILKQIYRLLPGIVILAPTLVAIYVFGGTSLWLVAMALVCLLTYAMFAWSSFLTKGEKQWAITVIRTRLRSLKG